MASVQKPHRNAGSAAAVDVAEHPVEVDFPAEGEVVHGGEYAMRVGVGADSERVDVRVNQGAWQPCRRAAGYWWFDWTAEESGLFEVTARSYPREGLVTRSQTRRFEVRLP